MSSHHRGLERLSDKVPPRIKLTRLGCCNPSHETPDPSRRGAFSSITSISWFWMISIGSSRLASWAPGPQFFRCAIGIHSRQSTLELSQWSERLEFMLVTAITSQRDINHRPLT
jgi:hypothetical protein